LEVSVVETDPIAGFDLGDIHLVDHWDACDDGPHGDDRVCLGVNDGCWR
jgi:hypothetical protein